MNSKFKTSQLTRPAVMIRLQSVLFNLDETHREAECGGESPTLYLLSLDVVSVGRDDSCVGVGPALVRDEFHPQGVGRREDDEVLLLPAERQTDPLTSVIAIRINDLHVVDWATGERSTLLQKY